MVERTELLQAEYVLFESAGCLSVIRTSINYLTNSSDGETFTVAPETLLFDLLRLKHGLVKPGQSNSITLKYARGIWKEESVSHTF